MWINQNFLLQDDVQSDNAGINFAFMSLRGSGPFHFQMDNNGTVCEILIFSIVIFFLAFDWL